MVFQNNVLSGAGGSGTTTHTIAQSIRFNSADSAYMSRTPSSTGNRKTFTSSFWVKLGDLTDCALPMPSVSQSANYGAFLSSGIIQFFIYYTGSSWQGQLYTNRVFRDPSAWYHFVIVVDTTQAASTERVRIYVNGQRETSFSTENYPSQNQDTDFNNSGEAMGIGVNAASFSGSFGEYYAAEMVYIDGTAYGPENFGEYNSSGIWVPKDVSGLTFGTNGFHIDGRDSSDLGDDESGNGNDFSTSGLATHDQVSDSPTNNFSTMNPLANPGSVTVAEGNLKATMTSGTKKGIYSTIAISSGKWYIEGRLTSDDTDSGFAYTGIEDYNSAINSGQYIGRDTYGYAYDPVNGGVLHNNSYVVSSGTLPSVVQGDIIQIAVDLDNNYIYWGKNGTFLNSGDPTSGSSGTGGVSVIDPASQPSGHYHIGHCNGTGSVGYQSEIVWNFGQDGTFAGGATAGGNSDGNGIGNFKYSVPSGYKALCTKNLGS
jgi:hypothetical protein